MKLKELKVNSFIYYRRTNHNKLQSHVGQQLEFFDELRWIIELAYYYSATK